VRDADVVHSHDRRSGLWVRLGPSHGALRVHTLHGLPEPYLDGRPGLKGRVAYGGLARALGARTDVLIAPSHAAARLLADRVGYALEDIVVVANGVDLPEEPFTRGALVGTLSAHEPVKGLDVFVAAMPLVLAARPGTRFVIYGTGSLEAELRERARGLPVEFPGHMPAPEALRSLAVLALPSHMETGDPAALAEAILALLDDPSAQIAAGRRAAAERTAARTAERMLDVYLRRS
jgi:phosphatidylinositol alpha-mannosyltransferase